MADSAEIEEAWMTLLNCFKALSTDSGQERSFQGQHPFLLFVSPSDAPAMTEDDFSLRLSLLAKHLSKGIKNKDDLILEQITALADASRDVPLLRSYYGLRKRPTPEDNASQLEALQDPDSILELARRALDLELTDLPIGFRKQALRIIANCCADNNTNRSLIIGRHGIDYMKLLADRREDLHVLLPSLYNVCAEYDEFAAGLDGNQFELSEQMNEPERKENSATLTIAEKELGIFNEKLNKTSLEIFLDLTYEVDSSHHAVLADVIELSSRTALFGLEHVFGATDSLTRSRRMRMLLPILTHFSRYYTADDDARASICQTYLNLFTQPAIQNLILQFPADLEALIELPYLSKDTTNETDQFTAAFLKLAYTISSLPTYTNTATPESNLIRNLAHRLQTNKEPTSPILVLLANSLTTLDGTSHFHRLHNLQSHVIKILLTHTDPETLLPALNLCTRLALTTQAQQDLFAADIFSVTTHLIQPAPQSMRTGNGHQDNRLEIHREALALTRLIIKSQPTHANSLLQVHAPLLTRIIDLAATSVDATSKVEAGRLVVEILRTLLSQNNPPPATADKTSQHLSSLTTPKAMNTILFLVTDAPSSILRAEGLFGLGLLSTLPETTSTSEPTVDPGAKATIKSCLYTHREKILPIFRTILANQADRQNPNHNPKQFIDQDGTAPAAGTSIEGEPTLEEATLKPLAINPQTNPDIEPDRNSKGSSCSTNAEVENLKFLLSHLLQTHPQPTKTSTDTEEQQFIQSLRELR